MKHGRRTPADTEACIRQAAGLIREARFLSAFTGAGISVESGVPAFRGPGGLWSRYDPKTLELDYFHRHPEHCWRVLKEIFYDCFAGARPNEAHRVLARWQARGLLKVLITQNIDNLHHEAGSRDVIEFHGSSRFLVCTLCGSRLPVEPSRLETLPPRCACGGLLKPDMIFFGEGIPESSWFRSLEAARRSDVMLVVGSTGEVYPAAGVPFQAAEEGARIVEINPEPSNFTATVSSLFIPLPAGEALSRIDRSLEGG